MISRCKLNEAFQLQVFYTGTLLTPHDYDVNHSLNHVLEAVVPSLCFWRGDTSTWYVSFSGVPGRKKRGKLSHPLDRDVTVRFCQDLMNYIGTSFDVSPSPDYRWCVNVISSTYMESALHLVLIVWSRGKGVQKLTLLQERHTWLPSSNSFPSISAT
jgi:hypothetical protein